MEAVKAYGLDVAKKYVLRINTIKETKNIDELKRLPGLRCHELHGDLAGKWAINLNDRYRLIFSLEGNTLEIVCIEEVSKHYGD